MITVKPEIRILGIDDGAFTKNTKRVLIIGTIFRSGKYIEGVLSTYIKKDGLDSTIKIIRMINKSKHKQQLRVIMLNGIALGGFNVVDIQKLFNFTKLPVIVISRRKPNFDKILKALKNFDDYKKRWEIIKNAGKVYSLKISGKNIYFQFHGIDKESCEKIIKLCATHSLVPEPIRVAHLIASGVSLGESKGRV